MTETRETCEAHTPMDSSNLVVAPSTPVKDNLKQDVKGGTDSGYGKTQSTSNTGSINSVDKSSVEPSVQDPVSSDHQGAVNQLPIATPAPPTSVNTGTTAYLHPEQATCDGDNSVSELVCGRQPLLSDIKMLTSVNLSEVVLGCGKLFPDSFKSLGDGYVLPR